jgi:membrane protease YdiL (CAAX protease family)
MTDVTLPKPGADLMSQPCRTWGFWPTTIFGVISILVWVLAQTLAGLAVLKWLGTSLDASDLELNVVTTHALTISIATIASMPPATAVLFLAVWRARCSMVEYFALTRPARKDLLIGIAFVAVLVPLGDLTSYLTGHDIVPASIVDLYKTARASGHILTLAFALIVIAPLMEELLFRGFLFRGYAASRIGVTGAILLTSVIWAAMHIQYDLFYIVQIVVLGCVFGWIRWRSGTTLLTIILHALVNLTALLQVAYLVERAA